MRNNGATFITEALFYQDNTDEEGITTFGKPRSTWVFKKI